MNEAPQKFTDKKPAAKSLAAKAAPTQQPNPETAQAVARQYSLNNSTDIKEVANQLRAFVDANNLATSVQGKEFVNIEAWQYAGSFFGLVAMTDHVINVSTPDEMKYQAKVVVHNPETGRVYGCGIMVCSNKESGKKFYQEYAIMSMAATRATGKAYRLMLSFLVRLAGYEATPAEEMDYNTAQPTPAVAAPHALPVITQGPINQPAPAMQGVGTDEAAAPVQWATTSQKEEIIRLLNHPMITRPEKTKYLLNINRLDEERAIKAIAYLRETIDARENGTEQRPTSNE